MDANNQQDNETEPVEPAGNGQDEKATDSVGNEGNVVVVGVESEVLDTDKNATETLKNESSEVVHSDVVEKAFRMCREAIIGGAIMEEAAKAYGLSYEAVVKRSYREKWPTPQRVAKMKKKLEDCPSPVEMAARGLIERGELVRSHLLDSAEKAAKRLASDAPEARTWSDAKVILEIADRISGLEKPQGPSILLLGDTLSTRGPRFYEASTVSAGEDGERPGEESEQEGEQEEY